MRGRMGKFYQAARQRNRNSHTETGFKKGDQVQNDFGNVYQVEKVEGEIIHVSHPKVDHIILMRIEELKRITE